MSKKVWFISDTHFYHKNIIKYCNRPFLSVEEMNQTIIKNWNHFIKPNDSVFHLGDFGFWKKGNCQGIGKNLNGKKTLIIGNHDTKPDEYFIKAGFEFIYHYPIIFEEFFILSHDPVRLNRNGIYVNIHGHIHNNHKIGCESFEGKNLFYNVSVEVTNYSPVSFDKIKKYYEVE